MRRLPPQERPRPILNELGEVPALRNKPHLLLVEGHLEDPCWVVWSRSRGPYFHPGFAKYATLTLADGRTVVAHRYAWAAANNADPAGFAIHHKCFEGRCVNPTHLALVTFGQNSRLNNFEARIVEPVREAA